MVGRICWEEGGRFRVVGTKTALQGLPLYQVSLSPQGKGYLPRLKRGIRLFRTQQVGQILLPVDFQAWDVLRQGGLRPYDPLNSLQSLGDLLALRHLRRLGIAPSVAKVALVGERVTPSFQAVALALCPLVAQLSIVAPQGGEALQRHLYRHYGMATGFPWEQCSLLLGFDKIPEENIPPLLPLHQANSPGFSGISMKNPVVPADISPLSWMGLLLETGRLGREELEFT